MKELDKKHDDFCKQTISRLIKNKALSYFELMKACMDVRIYNGVSDVRILMQLTERTGLKMIEW